MEWPGLEELPGLSDLRERFRHRFVPIAYSALAALGLQVGRTWGWNFCLGLIATVGLVAWALAYGRARALAEIATSRIGSAAQGYVALVGRASGCAGELIHCPYSGTICVWYRYTRYSRSLGSWRVIESGTSDATFELSDASGTCRIDPEFATVIAPKRRVSEQDGDKLVEELLLPGSPISVLGDFTTLNGTQAALSVRDDVSALLAEWKQDPAELRRRLDLDGTGELDLQEWELARKHATRMVEQQHREIRSLADLNIVRSPANGRIFLISALPPHRLRRRYLGWSAFHLVVALLALGLFVDLHL